MPNIGRSFVVKSGQTVGVSQIQEKMGLNKSFIAVINTSVRWFRNIWFALAALLWLPAFAHCQLESLTGLEFLQCAEAAPASPAPAQDCNDCCAVEKSHFRAEHHRLSVPLPDLLPVFFTVSLTPDAARRPQGDLTDLTAAPPGLPQSWQFVSRTALPVRAPSFVS